MIRNDTAFAWLAYQRKVGDTLEWRVPFEETTKNNVMMAGDRFEVMLKLSWHRGGAEVGEKTWIFPILVQAGQIETDSVTHTYLVDLSKAYVRRKG